MTILWTESTDKSGVRFREELATGIRCRISTTRNERMINRPERPSYDSDLVPCPFCPERVCTETPVFPDGTRIIIGESVTFPNLYPFAHRHVVTVITREHNPVAFTIQQIRDALSGQARALSTGEGYPAINWNYLPSAGASMVHPHMQGIADPMPSFLTERYLQAGRDFHKNNKINYWEYLREKEESSPRYLFGDEICWCAAPVPIGEKEIRGYLPIATIEEFETYLEPAADGILQVIRFFESMGSFAFNMAIRFDCAKNDNSFRAFLSMIARINPNPKSTSDSAFMERMHFEPVVMTLPEQLGEMYRTAGR